MEFLTEPLSRKKISVTPDFFAEKKFRTETRDIGTFSKKNNFIDKNLKSLFAAKDLTPPTKKLRKKWCCDFCPAKAKAKFATELKWPINYWIRQQVY